MNLSDLPLLAKKDLNKLYMSVAFPHPVDKIRELEG